MNNDEKRRLNLNTDQMSMATLRQQIDSIIRRNNLYFRIAILVSICGFVAIIVGIWLLLSARGSRTLQVALLFLTFLIEYIAASTLSKINRQRTLVDLFGQLQSANNAHEIVKVIDKLYERKVDAEKA